MFSTEDYIELISGGVDAGLVSLVEGAYTCLFETISGDSIPVRPVNYKKIAENLGIDVSDCAPDGRDVESKVTSNPEFRKLSDFVDTVLDLGIDYSGIGYRDESGVIKYNYPEFAKNPALRNILTNCRSTLLDSLSGYKNMSYDRMELGEALGRKIGRAIHKNFLKTLNRLYRTNPADISTDDVTPDNLDNQFYVSSDKNTVWYRNPDNNALESNKGSKILLDKNGDADNIFPKTSFSDDWADAIECIVCGPVHGMNQSFCEYYARENDAYDWYKIMSKLSTKALVAFQRKIPDMFETIARTQLDADNTSLYPILKAIELMVKAYDTGAIDAEAVTDIVGHADDPVYAMENYGPDLIDVIATVFGPGRKFDTRPLTALPDLPEAISGGKTSSLDVHDAASASYFNTDDDDVYIHKVEYANASPAGVKLLSSPSAQMRICKSRGIESLVTMCRTIAHNRGYCIPIDPKILQLVFRSGNRTTTKMYEIVSLYSTYVNILLGDNMGRTPTFAKVSSRNASRILDDIRQYITPRIQRELFLTENGRFSDNHSVNVLMPFVERVPGFRLEPFIGAHSDIFTTDNTTMHHMSTTAFIAYMRKLITLNTEHMPSFIVKATSPEVIDDVYHKTPLGLRVIDLMLSILVKSKCLNALFANISNMLSASLKTSEEVQDVEQFMNTYVVPNRSKLADTVVSIVNDAYSRVQDDYYCRMPFGYGLVAIMKYLRNPNGKRPSIASMLFMSRGSWFDFNTKAWANEQSRIAGEMWMIYMLDSYFSKGSEELPLLAVATLSGQPILHDLGKCNISFETRTNLLRALFTIDSNVVERGNANARIVSDSDFTEMINDNPKMLLVVMNELSPDRKEMAKKICFTPEFMDSLANSLDGMRLLLELGKVSGMEGFSQEFIITHRNKIADAIDLMEQMGTDEREIAEIRSKMLGSNRNLQQEGGKINDSLLGRVEFSIANGLRWMTGFVQLNNDNEGLVQNDDGNCTLFSRERAENLIELLSKNSSWRLPTSAELENLGSADTIAKLGIGFSETGKADESGNLDAFYSSGCYAWYSDNGTLGGYSVTYDMIDIDDSDIEEGDMLAIKLVSRI